MLLETTWTAALRAGAPGDLPGADRWQPSGRCVAEHTHASVSTAPLVPWHDGIWGEDSAAVLLSRGLTTRG